MSRVDLITHNGKKIVFIDYSGLKGDELFRTMEEAKKNVHSQEKGTVLILSNVKDLHFNVDIIEAFKNMSLESKEYIKAVAIYGLSGLQKIALNAVTKFSKVDMSVFGNKEEALDWLAGI